LGDGDLWEALEEASVGWRRGLKVAWTTIGAWMEMPVQWRIWLIQLNDIEFGN
jgi:hypothetical protein